MFACIDAVGIGLPPTRDAQPAKALFVIVWVIMSALCLINLFVGVLVKTLNDMRKREDSATFATPNQKQWAEALGVMLALRPRRRARPPTIEWRKQCHALTTSRHFEPVVLLVILVNTLLMALGGYDNPPMMDTILVRLNAACTVVFILEAAIKIGALQFGEYIREPWHIFDFVPGQRANRGPCHAACYCACMLLCLRAVVPACCCACVLLCLRAVVPACCCACCAAHLSLTVDPLFVPWSTSRSCSSRLANGCSSCSPPPSAPTPRSCASCAFCASPV
jgi:hypothetical protein